LAEPALSVSWGAAGKDGQPEERGQYMDVRTRDAGARRLPPAASGPGGAGLRPAGARAAQEGESAPSGIRTRLQIGTLLHAVHAPVHARGEHERHG
jgi:hypothetical protein